MKKLLIYDHVRVNGGSNYEYSGQRWIPRIKYEKIKRDEVLTMFSDKCVMFQDFGLNIILIEILQLLLFSYIHRAHPYNILHIQIKVQNQKFQRVSLN